MRGVLARLMTTAAVALYAACCCHMMKQTCRKDSRIGGCSLSSGEYVLCLFTLPCFILHKIALRQTQAQDN